MGGWLKIILELSILGTTDLVILEPVQGRVDQDLFGNNSLFFQQKLSVAPFWRAESKCY